MIHIQIEVVRQTPSIILPWPGILNIQAKSEDNSLTKVHIMRPKTRKMNPEKASEHTLWYDCYIHPLQFSYGSWWVVNYVSTILKYTLNLVYHSHHHIHALNYHSHPLSLNQCWFLLQYCCFPYFFGYHGAGTHPWLIPKARRCQVSCSRGNPSFC